MMSTTKITNCHSETVDPDKKAKKSWQAYLSGSPVLLISILLHVLFAALAAYFIVQRIETRRKVNFEEVSIKSSAAAAQAEHKVEMTQKKNAMTMPDINERITTTAMTPIALPEISLPSDSSAPSGASKLGAADIGGLGNNVGQGAGMGAGMQSTKIEIDTMDIATAAFGMTDGKGIGLPGRYYNLTSLSSGISSHANYYQELVNYITKGMPDTYFYKYFQGSRTLYLTQLTVPFVPFDESAKAFSDMKVPDPHDWVAIYKGKFVVPHTGTYRFVGHGDDICAVGIDKKEVFERIINDSAGRVHPEEETYEYIITGGEVTADVVCVNPETGKAGFTCGDWIKLEQGTVYDIKIIIGDDTGTSSYWLMVEEKGRSYESSAPRMGPLLPLLRFSGVKEPVPKGLCPPYDNNTDIGWRVVDDSYTTGDKIPEDSPNN